MSIQMTLEKLKLSHYSSKEESLLPTDLIDEPFNIMQDLDDVDLAFIPDVPEDVVLPYTRRYRVSIKLMYEHGEENCLFFVVSKTQRTGSQHLARFVSRVLKRPVLLLYGTESDEE
jgi:hypothetical protein